MLSKSSSYKYTVRDIVCGCIYVIVQDYQVIRRWYTSLRLTLKGDSTRQCSTLRRRSRPSWSWQKLLTQCPNRCAMLLTLHSKLSSKFTSYYSSELLVLQREEFNLLQKAKCYPFGPYNSALHFSKFSYQNCGNKLLIFDI